MNFSLKRYIISFVLAFILSAVVISVFSIVFHFFSPPQWLYSGIVRYFAYFSACLAAFFSALGTGKNGLIRGFVCADIYMLLLILAGVLFLGNSVSVNSAVKIFGITTVLGAFFGVLGINLKK